MEDKNNYGEKKEKNTDKRGKQNSELWSIEKNQFSRLHPNHTALIAQAHNYISLDDVKWYS